MSIHPTAVVDRTAELGDVRIGPFAVVGAGARLEDGVVLGPHAVVEADVLLRVGVSLGAHAVVQGPTEVGARTEIHAHAVLGGAPQDRKHDGSPTRLVVGEDNVFREGANAHRGSSAGRGVTVIGDRNYFMANSHVAHDCIVGNDTMFANSAAIAGHVEVADGVVLGGLSAVHQHCRVGRLAMVGGGAMCSQDVPPFTLAQGDRARLFGLNVIGLRRAGLDPAAFSALKSAWRLLFTSGLPLRTALSKAREECGVAVEATELLDFVAHSARGVCRAAGDRFE